MPIGYLDSAAAREVARCLSDDAKLLAQTMDDETLTDLVRQSTNDILQIIDLQQQLSDKIRSLAELHCYVSRAVCHRIHRNGG